MIELQFYPEYIGDNPYIELFYKALEPYGVRARDNLLIGSRYLHEQAACLDIVHIQWCPERIWRGDRPARLGDLRNVARLWKYLHRAKGFGLRVVWTVHDLVHHDQEKSGFIDRCGYRVLARAADLCICHTATVRQHVVHRYGARRGRTVVMPIGNYDGVFSSPQLRLQTLSSLRLSPSARTLLCFGMIRPYKGFELALHALRELDVNYQMIIAGLPYPEAYGRELREAARDLPNVHMILERVDHQRLADLIHAADCVLLPYRQITGSAALLTALTLGRGVVVSDLPFFREILALDPAAGVFFSSRSEWDTARAIREFFSIPLECRHNAARRIADQFAWASVIRPVADWLQQTFPEKARGAAPSTQ
jgi:glycosyltransferase involved in cell wall biosynthesis